MKKPIRILSLLLAAALLLGLTTAQADEVPYYQIPSDIHDIHPLDDDVITLTAYSQLANYSGIQTGWSAALLKDLFNVELNIVPDLDGTYETRMASGNLGDLVIWGNNGSEYKNAIEKGMLLDWEEDDLGPTYAPYIFANYQDALASNRVVSGGDTLYGFGMDVAKRGSHRAFMYSWDIRWDLYKQLGYPDITDLDSLIEVFKQMKEICPTDELGNETYAASLWPDWDGSMVMYVKALATAYYGFDELGIGLYNPNTGDYYDCLREDDPNVEGDSPYIEMLHFFNKLYREGLLDPNSLTQTYEEMAQKVRRGGVFWGIFNYASSSVFNSDLHMAAGQMMYSRVPDEACPIVYGLNSVGGNRVWTIGADSEYPELCLAILDYLATPEGAMAIWYGPRGLMWDYNEDGGMYFTELGRTCNRETKTDLGGIDWVSPYTGKVYPLSANFNDGCIQINNTTMARDMVNPDGKLGEAFNKDTWVSELSAAPYAIQQDWRDWSGFQLADPYFENIGHYTVMPDIPYSETARDDTLEVKWRQVIKAITTNSWRAIFAKADGEFDMHLRNMRSQCESYGYDECVAWSKGEAALKWQLQQEQENIAN